MHLKRQEVLVKRKKVNIVVEQSSLSNRVKDDATECLFFV